MNLNNNEVKSSPLGDLKTQIDTGINKENYLNINGSGSEYLDNGANAIIQHEYEKANIKKKYKKNLVWDGPRWDLAHFDPAMSARERKKLVYYEGLFNKLEKNVVIKCSEHNNESNMRNQNQKRRMRSNTLDGDSKRELSEIKEIQEKLIGNIEPETSSTSNDHTETYEKKPLSPCISNQTGILLTPDRTKCEHFKAAILEPEHSAEPNRTQSSTTDREGSSIRRPNDWRVKLLNKRCSLQTTPYRVTS
ncbi:hypothetical protein OJ253_2411 [Cryptosporidium canis]|uniref:Uncharacterized protein n=1 Tax=Cryptosporidium canis TaxID=195482 RepID=A0A9D5HWQ2_9CRYT|nr:hypothetical protein OJ253_2411 [Cryptosporidium canis]